MTHIARSLNPMLDARDAEAELLLARAVVRWKGATDSDVIAAARTLNASENLFDRVDARLAVALLPVQRALGPETLMSRVWFWAGMVAMCGTCVAWGMV